jgi:hypothetical protein
MFVIQPGRGIRPAGLRQIAEVARGMKKVGQHCHKGSMIFLEYSYVPCHETELKRGKRAFHVVTNCLNFNALHCPFCLQQYRFYF